MREIVVHDYTDVPKSCSRCGSRWVRLIPCYWAPRHWVCPACAQDLNKLHDRDGWPEQGRVDGLPELSVPPEAPPVGPRPPGWPEAPS